MRLGVPPIPWTGAKVDFCPEGTQPGVLTPGIEKKCPAPKVAVEPLPETMEDVLKPTVDQNIFRPFRARLGSCMFLGLKPQAESYCPFGTPFPKIQKAHQRRSPTPVHGITIWPRLAAF